MTRYLFALLILAVGVTGCGGPAQPPDEPGAADRAGDTLAIGVMPKLIGIPFFNATERGAEEAARELGVELVFDGPVAGEGVEKQVQMIDTWIARRFDAIAVAPNDPDAIAPALAKARGRGIKVISWDADAAQETRDLFVNQATARGIAEALMDVMAEGAGPDARYVIVTGTLTAANQNIWMAEMEDYRRQAYPEMTNLSETPIAPGEDKARATQMAADALKTYPDMDGIFAITSVALPGAAEALRKAGDAAERIYLTGLATPSTMREYVKDGTVEQFVLWNPVDLGYLTVHVAKALLDGHLAPGTGTFEAGRLGEVEVAGDEVILGDPLVFDASNIDDFDF